MRVFVSWSCCSMIIFLIVSSIGWRKLMWLHIKVHFIVWHGRHSTRVDTVRTMHHTTCDGSLLLVIDALLIGFCSLGHMLEVQVTAEGICMSLCLHHIQCMLVVIPVSMHRACPDHHLLVLVYLVRLHHLVIEHALLLGKHVLVTILFNLVFIIFSCEIVPVWWLDLEVFLFTVDGFRRCWSLGEQAAGFSSRHSICRCCKWIDVLLLKIWVVFCILLAGWTQITFTSLLGHTWVNHEIGLVRHSNSEHVMWCCSATEVEQLVTAKWRCMIIGWLNLYLAVIIALARLRMSVLVIVSWSLHCCTVLWLLLFVCCGILSDFLLALTILNICHFLNFSWTSIIVIIRLDIILTSFSTGHVCLLVGSDIFFTCFSSHRVELARDMLVVAWRRQLAVWLVILRSHCFSKFKIRL